MNTWICRILTVVFFVNTLPAQTWAQLLPRKQLSDKAIEQIVSKKSVEELEKEDKAILQKILTSDDLSPREKKYAELELQIIETNIELLDRQANAPIKYINELPKIYAARLADLEARKHLIEVEEALANFYHEAQSIPWIGAAVAAMHKHDQYVKEVIQKQDNAFAADKNSISLYEPSTFNIKAISDAMHNQSVPLAQNRHADVLTQWENNELTLEELVEYVDPIQSKQFIDMGNVFKINLDYVSVQSVADAAELLYAFFYSFNANPSQLDQEAKDNAIWMAKRLKVRIAHQLATRGKNITLDARANLMLLLGQVNVFLAANYTETAADKEADLKVEGYNDIVRELNASKDDYHAWEKTMNNIPQEMINQVMQEVKNKPALGSSDYELLKGNIEVLTGYLMSTKNTSPVKDLIISIDKDGDTFHGYYEGLVTSFFSALYNSLATLESSSETRKWTADLLLCTAGPKCTHHGKEVTNAVNVRVQALAVASMLKQEADKNVLINPLTGQPAFPPGPFNEQSFRTQMARYAVDIYQNTRYYNVHKHYTDLSTPIEDYGLDITEELPALDKYLVEIFGSFLPVPEPDVTLIRNEGYPFHGCLIRVFNRDSEGYVRTKPMSLSALTAIASYSVNNLNGLDHEGKEIESELCKNHPSISAYGGYDTVIVSNSKGNLVAMDATLPDNTYIANERLAKDVMWEAFTWYAWGAAFKAVGYMWKAAKAATIAAKTAVKAQKGFKLARFESKFSQVWKFSGNQWLKEMGIFEKLGKPIKDASGDYYYLVTMTRQGARMTVKVASNGKSLRSIGQRLLFRKELQRAILKEARQVAATGGKQAANNVRRFSTAMTKTEQAAAQGEHFLAQGVKGEIDNVYSLGGSSVTVKPGRTVGTRVYSFGGSPKIINPKTGLPDKLIADASGNLYGKATGTYAGTIASANASSAEVAYTMSQGLLKGKGYMPGNVFMRGLSAELSPVTSPIKWALATTAVFKFSDPLLKMTYLDPLMEQSAKDREIYFSRKHGIPLSDDESDNEQLTEPTVLEKVQGLPGKDSVMFSTISSAFFGANKALNIFLPNWAIDARRKWFSGVSSTTELLNEYSIIKNLFPGEELPSLFDVMLMKPMIWGDPTGQLLAEDGSVEDDQYRKLAHAQRMQQARDGHDAKVFKNENNKAIAQFKKDKQLTLDALKEYLDALPNGAQEMGKVYDDYIQALQEANTLADTDLDKAYKTFENAQKAFIKDLTDVRTRAIKAYYSQQEEKTLAEIQKAFTDVYYKGFLNNKEAQKELKRMVKTLYEQTKATMLDFYAEKITQQEAERALQEAQAKYEASITELDKRLSVSSPARTQRVVAKDGREALGTLESFLNNESNAPLLAALPDSEKLAKRIYKTHEQNMKEIEKLAKTDPEQASIRYDEALLSFEHSKTDLLLQAIDAYTAAAKQAELDYYNAVQNVLWQGSEKADIIKAIGEYWADYAVLLKQLYSAPVAYMEQLYKTEVDPNLSEQAQQEFVQKAFEANQEALAEFQQLTVAQIQKLKQDFAEKIDATNQTLAQRSLTIQSAY